MTVTADDNLKRLEEAPVGRLLWQYALPAVVGMLVMQLYSVVDRIFIGQVVGAEAIAGLAITFPVMNLATALGVLIGAGASARVSLLLGMGRAQDARLTLGNSLTLTLGIGAIYLLGFAMGMDTLLVWFGANDATLPYARDFMMFILPGLLMTNLAFSFNNIMRAAGFPMRAMVTMFIGAGVNILLAPLFIYCFGWGIKGAAIATDIAMTISMLFVMRHFFTRGNGPVTFLNSGERRAESGEKGNLENVGARRRRALILRIDSGEEVGARRRRALIPVNSKWGIYRLEERIVWPIIGIGMAPSIINVASCAINILINRTLLHYGGVEGIAAAGIFVTVTTVFCCVMLGICQGMQPIVGYNYGARHFDRVRRVFWLAVAAASAISFMGWGAGMTIPNYLARAFVADFDLVEFTGHALRTSMVNFWMVGFQIIATCYFQSIGRMGCAIFLSLTRQVLFFIPLLLWLPTLYGVDGVWRTYCTSDIFATLVTAGMIFWALRRLRRA